MFENIQYMVVEGVIGVGKTSLVSLLSKTFSTGKILEHSEENPFLAEFYRNREKYAFQTQVWFLLSRFRQIQDCLAQPDLFSNTVISDFMFAKDKIFACLNLDENELSLYHAIAGQLEGKLTRPDYVIYLQASTDVLLERVAERGRPFEKNMSRAYLDSLNRAYNEFFFHYDDSPLLIVDTDQIDFVKNVEELDEIVAEIQKCRKGTRYYNPLGKIKIRELSSRSPGRKH